MHETTEGAQGSHSLIKRRVLVAHFVLILALGLLIGWKWLSLKRSIQFSLQEVQSKGLPLTMTGLDDFYRIPEGTPDSTVAWDAALSAVQQAEFRKYPDNVPFIITRPVSIPSPDELWDELEMSKSFIERHQGVLELIRIAADQGGAIRRDIVMQDILDGHASRSFVAIEDVQNLLLLAATVSLHEGDSRQCFEDLMDSRALAISLRYEPNTISPVSWGNHRQFAWTVERMVPLAGFSDEQLESLQRRAMEDDPKEWVHRMLIADRVRIISITEKVSLGLHHNAFLAEYLESIGRLESSLSQSWPEPMHEFRREGMMIRELKDDPKADKRHLLLVGAKHLSDHFGNSMGESIALQRTTAVGLACHRYVVQKRRLPSTIEDVVPFLPGSVDSRQELIIDPCSGKPLQLKPTKSGLHVISVGSNQIDNDGSETVVGWYSQDIVFEVTYPSHQITR